ncbi:ATP-binding protein [Sphingomonas sp. LHG3406-1]|uniref:ATP-binding protein n=1 Tax=Sphingomonas sp. LHG3406-1 TaxID=2804617 RepID=UPI002636BC3C|nr:ATP-binding protein [Sphingomonas sp. LHG3406-1]
MTRGWPLLSAALMFVLSVISFELVTFDGRVASLWLSNGAVIALLLRRPRSGWPMLLVAALVGNITAALVIGDEIMFATALALCNIAEILLVASLFKWRHPQAIETITLEIIGVLAIAGLIGSLVSTGMAITVFSVSRDPIALTAAWPWFLADLNGLLIVTPLALSLSLKGLREEGASRDYREFGLLVAVALLVCLAIFSSKVSSLFLMAPVLVLAALRLGVRRVAILLALVCITAGVMTVGGSGPLHAPHIDVPTRIFLLQLFMSTAVLLTLPVAVVRMERLNAAAELRTSEEEYRLLANHGSDLILRLDCNGHAHFLSGAVHRLLGLDIPQLAGPSWLERLHPDDAPPFAATLAESQRRGGASTSFRLRHANNQWRWVEANIRVAEGEVAPASHGGGESSGVLLIASLRDVHQRRRAELLADERQARLHDANRLLLMAEGLASLGHWTFDHAAGVIQLSPEAKALVHLPAAELSAETAIQYVARDDRRLLLARVAQARRIDVPVECTVRFGGPAGERTLQLRMQQTQDEGSGPRLFGVISDITEKLEADRKLVSALDDARTAAEARSRFLATMSHEIRTPMTGVLGTIELLSDNPPPEQRQIYLDTMRESADLLMSVLDDILDFSKIDAGQFTFADEPFDLGHTVRATTRLFDRPASARGLSLNIDAPEEGETWLRGDALRLRQVLSNLLSNAIKFSERGVVTVRCSVEPRSNARSRLRLTVQDKGLGMSPEAQEQLFEPFTQGDTAVGRGGTGLGLAISRRLVTGMGGTISVRSALGRGSAFTVSLTLPQAAPQPRAAKRPATAAGRPLDLLLVEDNPVNQLLVSALLKRMGHKVTCAADGLLAIEVAAERRFDLILMDMHMPRCDGLCATHRIRTGGGPNAAAPIIALTADAASERRAIYTERGIDALLTKPVDCDALAATLNRLVWGGAGADVTSQRDPRPLAATLDPEVISDLREALGSARLGDLLELLASELDGRSRAIRQALADRDRDRAAAEAHSLKGAAANLGARQVADAAFGLEQAIKSASPCQHTDLGPALRSLALAVEETQAELAKLRLPQVALASNG